MRMRQSLGTVDKIQLYCGTSLDGLIDFYSPLNQGDWELIESLGFRFMVGPNFGGTPLLESAFLKEKYSELGHT